MVRLWYCVALILLFVGTIQAARTVYSFESTSHLNDFTAPSTSTLERSTTRYKNGTYSMKWTWKSGDSITHKFTNKGIQGNELKRGGIKLWLYNTHKRIGDNEKLTVSFLNTRARSGNPTTVSEFKINLNFKGWRAIWVSYTESKRVQISKEVIDTLKITAPATTQTPSPLFMDMLRFVNNMNKQSRDEIVPPINNKPLYTINNFWQQTYKWSLATPTTITEQTPSKKKLGDLTLIEKRLENWFVKQTQSSLSFKGNVKKRFESLGVDQAHQEFVRQNIKKTSDGVITGEPLYASRSDLKNYGQFGDIVYLALLPIALDYHIRSRAVDVDSWATHELNNLNGAAKEKAEAIKKIAGGDQTMQQTFTTALGSAPYTVEKVKDAINKLNDKRKERVMLLFDFIEDQGFADGSGLGTLDHEMNNAGAGFMNSAFLLRKEIQASGKLPDFLATMKWYCDFGEVYQKQFEYAGTSADRMRTIALWRLFIVLMMPTTTAQQKQEKIRDMEALGRWYANAFSPNEAFGGVLKPDYLGYHHNSYYASAYSPQALLNAAFIQYLISGTSFALSDETRGHIKKGLQVLRIVSVKYSSPNSVGGRFPGFSRYILVKVLPVFVYAAATAPSTESNGSLGEVSILDIDMAKIFLRLFDTTERRVNDYLADGKLSSNIFYLNSIGSINIMEEIYAKASKYGETCIIRENSPQGFWAKNYAALVIHRRDDWAVTVKGFNRFVWDFESKPGKQNAFGLYQSHGALLVANSEEALKTHDVKNGWDWTRHPGTTTIKLDFKDLISENRRYYQPKKLAGGLSLVGGGDYPTGIFGMEFSQPTYKYPKGSFHLKIKFTFQKSVFFIDNIIICLGTGISSSNSRTHITQTTLFQNKLLNPSKPSSIHIGRTTYKLESDVTKKPSDFGDNSATILRDVNGNGYYVPKANNQGLNLKISLQKSLDERRPQRETSARYATAWLNHGVNPTDKTYEYAIVVGKPPESVRDLAKWQASSNNKVYEVLYKDKKAHVVKLNNYPKKGQTQYGYVFFDKSAKFRRGPVRKVNTAPCLVMVEEVDKNNLYIAVSSPDLNFNITKRMDSSSGIKARERFYSVSRPVKITVTVNQPVNVDTGDVKEDGVVVADKTSHVKVLPLKRDGRTTQGLRIRFKQLVKGFSKEVKLTR